MKFYYSDVDKDILIVCADARGVRHANLVHHYQRVDWNRGALSRGHILRFAQAQGDEWTGRGHIAFGATVTPASKHVDLTLWLRNGTSEPLTKMRTQVCAMLKGVTGCSAQSNDGKTLDAPVAAAKIQGKDRWILVAFDHCGGVWANPPCPCMHSDPVLPDAAPGETVEVRGRMWFHEGADITGEIEKARKLFAPKAAP